MPTSITRGGVGSGRPLEGFAFPASYRPNDTLISVWSWQACGEELTGIQLGVFASGAVVTNRVYGFMFGLADSFLVQKVWWNNGTTATTNQADVGVYDEAGTTLLVSAGSQNIATANVVQEFDVTDTLLKGGQRYWCCYAQNGTTATPICMGASTVGALRAVGVAQFAGAVPLGATFTPAAVANLNFPMFGIAGRTQVA